MKKNRDYEIPHLSLQPGTHHFSYQLEKEFFDTYVSTDFEKPNFKVDVELEKNPQHLFMKFTIEGEIHTNCDRCGNDLVLPIWDEFELIIKWVGDSQMPNEDEDEDSDIVFINKSEHLLDISDWLNEYVILSIPIQRAHPDAESEDSTCYVNAQELLKPHQQVEDKKEVNIFAEQLSKIKIKK
jgi:uncharacterized metal-binding protein YceD (DUF177 family)